VFAPDWRSGAARLLLVTRPIAVQLSPTAAAHVPRLGFEGKRVETRKIRVEREEASGRAEKQKGEKVYDGEKRGHGEASNEQTGEREHCAEGGEWVKDRLPSRAARGESLADEEQLTYLLMASTAEAQTIIAKNERELAKKKQALEAEQAKEREREEKGKKMEVSEKFLAGGEAGMGEKVDALATLYV
jgi:hypothetical protein